MVSGFGVIFGFGKFFGFGMVFGFGVVFDFGKVFWWDKEKLVQPSHLFSNFDQKIRKAGYMSPGMCVQWVTSPSWDHEAAMDR